MIYKFTLAPCGPIGTPFRSDTLFGHACWTILFNEGEERFREFRDAAAEQQPELVFSDGFPCGWLPKPHLPYSRQLSEQADEYARLKKSAKRQWIKRDIAEKYGWNLSDYDSAGATDDGKYSDKPHEQAMLRNVISRMTGTSLDENGLYSQNQFWYNGIWENIDVYISTDWEIQRLTEFLEKMFAIGYGRDQTVGVGKVSIVEKPVSTTFTDTGSGWSLSLSHAIPCEKIIVNESFYRLETKYGRVWSALGADNPFKKRLLQTVPGAVFRIATTGERAGCVVADIHDRSEVIENCMTILYPLPATALQGVAL